MGSFSALRLLDRESTVTFVLRNSACFDEDERIQGFLSSGKAYLVKGDALVRSDVQKRWEAAEKKGGRKIDILLLTEEPHRFPSPKASTSSQPTSLPSLSPTAQSFLNTLSTIPKAQLDPPAQPKLVVVSSAGVTKDSHTVLLSLLKPLYSTIPVPRNDELGLEHLAHYSAGWSWNERDASREVLPADWHKQENFASPGFGTLKDIMVV
ncbi:hypothetical protein V5O48_012447 [Marasmius crinis-equi]|uniref:Uncharacterized protein n=1 Tax=Marasmius crinis-equi TaxID=585013 RepID=A0ABR3F2T3_9AGAR